MAVYDLFIYCLPDPYPAVPVDIFIKPRPSPCASHYFNFLLHPSVWLLQARWAGCNYIVLGCEKLAYVFWNSLLAVTQQHQSQASWWIYNASNWRCLLTSWFWRWGNCNGVRHVTSFPSDTVSCDTCRTGTEPVVPHVFLPPLVPEGGGCSSSQYGGSWPCGCLRQEPAGCCREEPAGAEPCNSVPLVAGDMRSLQMEEAAWGWTWALGHLVCRSANEDNLGEVLV